MTERPRIAPGLLAELIDAAPGRVRRKLDAAPRAAEEWTWTVDGAVWTVEAGNETVTLAGPDVTANAHLECTCLLSPRCLHLLSAASVLPHTDEESGPAEEPVPDVSSEDSGTPEAAPVQPFGGAETGVPGPGEAPGEQGGRRSTGLDGASASTGPDRVSGHAGRAGGTGAIDPNGHGDPLTTPVEPDDDARAAAALAWSAGARTLAAGVRAAGSSQRAELLRAAALARAARLPRLAAACTTVATGLRDHATPSFALAEHAEALTRLLDVSWRLGGGPDVPGALGDSGGARPRPTATLADVGIGRRAYTEVGSLRIHGLGSERVVTASGYAGVVTHAVSLARGPRLWRVGDVVPGDADRVAGVYGAGVNFGKVSLSHRELARAGMVAQRVSASADGRLSGGSATTAAVTAGCAWDDAPLAALWERPLAAQVGAALAAQAAPGHRTGADLVFADLTVTGKADGGAAVVERATGFPFVFRAADAQDHLRARNLLGLASEPGLTVRALARPVPERPGTLVPVTVSVPGLALPAAWKGRVNLSLDTLPAAGTDATAARVPTAPSGADPGLESLARRLARLAEAGREAISADPAQAARLRGNHLPTAAAVLTGVSVAARERVRTVTGESVVPPPDRLAAAWLAAMTYLAAARGHLNALEWSDRVGGPS